MQFPSQEELLSLENGLVLKGFTRIAGIDEVGRGPLAGPVVSASVVFQTDTFIEGVWDSKKLTPKKREARYFDLMVHYNLLERNDISGIIDDRYAQAADLSGVSDLASILHPFAIDSKSSLAKREKKSAREL